MKTNTRKKTTRKKRKRTTTITDYDDPSTSDYAYPDRRNWYRFALCGFLVFALFLPSLSAAATEQEPANKKIAPYALIFGTVWGPNGRPIHGVKVKIRRADQKKAKWELMSDRRGEFAQRVPAGKADYVIWADIKPPKGAKNWKKPETTVSIENEERVDIGLHLTE